MSRRVPPQLLEGPFTRAQAEAAGVSGSALRNAQWRQVLHGVWVHVAVPDTRELRVSAAALVLPPYAVLRGLTAAWVYGADVRRRDDLDVHVGCPAGKRVRSQRGLVVCQETLSAADVLLIDGVRVTTPVRTAFDCLRLLRGHDRLVVADALTHLQVTSVEELRRYFAGQRRLRNLRIGERLLDEVEPLAESPRETLLRLRLIEGGLPRPVAQHEVYDGTGAFVARLDLAYPEAKVAVEYDGAWHWEQRRDDDRRRDRLRALGWTVVVVSGPDLRNGAADVVAAVHRAMRLRRAG